MSPKKPSFFAILLREITFAACNPMFGKEIWASLLLLSLLAISTAEDRIYNGNKVPTDDLLNVVTLNFKSPEKTYKCTATVISKHHVLTAAHCFLNGTYVLKVQDRDNNQLAVDHWTIHSGYPGPAFDNDIAIITVEQPLKIPPVNLAANYAPNGGLLRVAGYGKTKYESKDGVMDYSDYAEDLMESYIQGHPKEKCTTKWPNVTGLSNVKGICVHHPNTGALPGDSGGPSFAKGKDGKYYQVAITSHGAVHLDAGGYYGIDTDVGSYCPWIEETTGGEAKCQTFEQDEVEID
uniref:Peptidase S1 domain-containing protein n=1 Tax=Panagrolaimus sp. JU765 TaxID=591449 RepID=A0AC34RQ29_9BILA